MKTYSTVFLSSACQLLLIINIFKSTVKTSETNLMYICNTVRAKHNSEKFALFTPLILQDTDALLSFSLLLVGLLLS